MGTRRAGATHRAVVVGALLSVSIVLVTTLVTVLGPSGGGGEPGHRAESVLGSWMSKQHSDSDSGDSDDSDSNDSGSKSGGSDDSGSKSGGSDDSGSDSDSGDSGDSGGKSKHHGDSDSGDSGGDSGSTGSGDSTDSGAGSLGANSTDGGSGSAGSGPTGLASPGSAGSAATGSTGSDSPGTSNGSGSSGGSASTSTSGDSGSTGNPGGSGNSSGSGGSVGANGGSTGAAAPSGPIRSSGSGAIASLPTPSNGGGVTTTRVLCSRSVSSVAQLNQVLRSANPDDVICFQQSSAGQPGGAGTVPDGAGSSTGGLSSTGGGDPSVTTQPSTGASSSTGTDTGTGTALSQNGGVVALSQNGGATANPATAATEGGPPGAGAPSQTSCAKQAADASTLSQALSGATPGERICVTGNLGGQRLKVSKGGTAQAPVSLIGNGKTTVKGISVDASNVVVDGFQVLGAAAPGIEIHGSNITVRNNTVSHPTGGDYDGLRFFGNNLKIVHNTIMNISPDGSGAHADCMQTFATGSDSPASQHVLIDGNKCQKIDNQCLIAEGPHSSAGDGSGSGVSADITFSNNICDVGASQATEIDDVQGVKVLHNLVTGKPDKAFSFQNKSTGAVVQANKIASGIGYEVGMDATSKVGYKGPKVGGEP